MFQEVDPQEDFGGKVLDEETEESKMRSFQMYSPHLYSCLDSFLLGKALRRGVFRSSDSLVSQ